MKKFAIVIAFLLLLSAVISLRDTESNAQAVFKARAPHCYQGAKVLYLGVREPVFHYRYAELDLNMMGCQSHKGLKSAQDNAARFSADVDPNSLSIAAGVEWHVKTPVMHSHNRWMTDYVVDGSYRKCVVYKVPICGPTGTFRAIGQYTADYLLHRSQGISRFEWEVFPTNDFAKDNMRIYSTP